MKIIFTDKCRQQPFSGTWLCSLFFFAAMSLFYFFTVALSISMYLVAPLFLVFSSWSLFFTRPPIEERSIVMIMSDMCLCVFVCPQACLWKYMSDLYQTSCACYLCPWLGRSLAALRYIMFFRFYGWRHTCAKAKAAQRGRPADGSTAHMHCSLGLGYKRRVGIPVVGQWTHTHGPTFLGTTVWAY